MISKAQRGDLVEGWNDCPSNMLMPNIKASSRTRRKAQRVGRDINGSVTKPEKEQKSGIVAANEKSCRFNSSNGQNPDIKAMETKILEVLNKTSLEENEQISLETQLLNAYSKFSPNDKIIFINIFLKIQQLVKNPSIENVDQLKKEISMFKIIQNEVNESCNLFLKIINNLKI